MVTTRHIYTVACTLCLAACNTMWGADTMTGIFSPRFASLQVWAGDNELNDPVIMLDDDRELTIEFDELSDDLRYMRYNITHCNADWQPSQLVESEYLDGFNEGVIEDYEFSRATTVHYVHYSLTLPNEQIQLKVSGNYLVRIYDESEPDNTLLQARFMVTEQKVTLNSTLSYSTDIDYKAGHQQLSLMIDTQHLQSRHDPFSDFKVVVRQNGRLDNEVTLEHPLRAQGSTLIYEHLPQLIFEAGNEYRRFENISVHSPSMHVDRVEYHGPFYHSYVDIDTPRNETSYNYDRTQHGRYVVREYNSTQPDIEADYLMTHFALATEPLAGAEVYLDGDFTQRRMDNRSRMIYNPSTHMYETALLLKQGAYNYQYLVKGYGEKTAHTGPVEGDFYNTDNEYTVAVYQRLPGQRYDRLAGYFKIIN